MALNVCWRGPLPTERRAADIFLVHDDTRALIHALQDELDKAAWVQRAHRELRSRGLCGANEGTIMKVRIELDVKITHGHPSQMLVLLHEKLPGVGLVDEEIGLLATVEHVEKLEIA